LLKYAQRTDVVFFFDIKSATGWPRLVRQRWKSDFKIGPTFFFEPICEKRACRKRAIGRTSGWHTVAPFPKCVPHCKSHPTCTRARLIYTYRRQCEVKGWGRARGCINLIKARILPSTEHRWAHVKIILKTWARA